MFEGVNLFVIFGCGIAFAGLSLSVIIGALKIGHLIGELVNAVSTLTKDISNLWNHQRLQDDSIGKLEQTLPAMATDIKWIKDAVEKMS